MTIISALRVTGHWRCSNMKKVPTIVSLSILAGFTLIAAVTSSVAWFSASAKITNSNNPVEGATMGAYFAYGDGSAEHPFGITKSRHVYNLAWLQYLGYFNNEGKQYYFEMDDDVDMGGLVIPPIGTPEHPYIGVFDGQGHVVSNFTTSNDFSDFVKHPGAVSSSDFNSKNIQIVGFFGIIGKYNQSYSFESSAISFTDTGLTNFTVKTTSAKTLIGLAAGYVDGTLANISIDDATFDISSSSKKLDAYNNISDYSLVGYATEDSLRYLDDRNVRVEVPNLTHDIGGGGGSDWNASIGMKDMFNKLLALYPNSTRTKYVSEETRYYNEDGTLDESRTVENNTANSPVFSTTNSGGSTSYGFYADSETNAGGHKIASFSFARTSNSSGTASTNNRYMYLYGRSEKTVNNGLTVHNYHDGHLITDGVNYLYSSSNTAVASRTDLNNYCYWAMDSDGYIKNIARNTYLYANGTTLANSTTKGTGTNYKWTYNSTSNSLTVVSSGTTYYLVYNSGWKLVTGSQSITLAYHHLTSTYNSTTYYLNVTWSGNNPTLSSSSTSNNTEWYTDGNYQYVLHNDTKYYLAYSNSRVTVANTTSNRFQRNGNYFSYTGTGWSSTTYYIRIQNGTTISRTDSTSNRTQINIVDITSPASSVKTYMNAASYNSGNTTEAAHYETNPTYFPLTYDDAGVDDNNTGYVVSGSRIAFGDIRVSLYYTSNIGTALNITSNDTYNSTLDKKMQVISASAETNGDFYLIKDTHNASTTTYSSGITNNTVGVNTTRKDPKDFGFKKYNSARNGLQSMLNGSSNIYGLHFMDSQISMSNITIADYVKVADKDRSKLEEGDPVYTEYTNYELPEDSIDFNLSSKGTINFFAGTYFTGNTTFFSLNHVHRYTEQTIVDGVTRRVGDIQSIKQISKIYKNFYTGSDIADEEERKNNPYTIANAPYIYLYSDSTYSDPNAATHMTYAGNTQTELFDMDWVMSPKMITNAVYYFEIPANKGEYALGSVAGKSGAYLMYLDIGAASISMDTILIEEQMTITQNTYVTPKGVDFAAVTSTGWTVVETIGGESSAIRIPNNVSGKIHYGYNASDDILTCGPPTGGSVTNGSTIVSTYLNKDVTLTPGTGVGTDGAISVVAYASSSKTIYKQTSYVYNSDTATLIKNVGYKENPEDEYENAEDECEITPDLFDYETMEEDEIIYEGTDPITVFNYIIISSGSGTNMKMIYDYEYTTQTYTFTITNLSSESTTLYITSVLSGYHIIINGSEVSAGSTVVVNPAS